MHNRPFQFCAGGSTGAQGNPLGPCRLRIPFDALFPGSYRGARDGRRQGGFVSYGSKLPPYQIPCQINMLPASHFTNFKTDQSSVLHVHRPDAVYCNRRAWLSCEGNRGAGSPNARKRQKTGRAESARKRKNRSKKAKS